MSGEKPDEADIHADCLKTIRQLTQQRDELLHSTELLLTMIGRHLPSLEEMTRVDEIRRALAKAHGEVTRHQSGRMIEVPLEQFYRFDRSVQEGSYSIKIDGDAGFGFFEDEQQGDEHGGSLWFTRSPDGALALAAFEGVGILPSAVIRGIERLGVGVAERFK